MLGTCPRQERAGTGFSYQRETPVGSQTVVALFYDEDAYVEAGGAAPGLMGRQVAGRSFLDAYLRHGTFSEMAAVVRERKSSASLLEAWRGTAHQGTPTHFAGDCQG